MDQDLRGDWRYQEPMAEHTSWRVGGCAEKFYYPKDLDDLSLLLQRLPKDEALFWCGLGSNTLVRDGGLKGCVIGTQKYLTHLAIDGERVYAQVGVSSATLARSTARLGLRGLEFLAGIPGTLGGALAMNAGCAGSEIWPWVTEVELINRAGQRSWHDASEFDYTYRHVTIPAGHGFVAARFALQQSDKDQALQRIRDLLARRTATQPTNEPSGGSTFCNPPGDHAARLIEAAGLKGYRIGGAVVSTKHANFIVSEPDCRAADIEALIAYLQTVIHTRTGILLKPEVKMVGEYL